MKKFEINEDVMEHGRLSVPKLRGLLSDYQERAAEAEEKARQEAEEAARRETEEKAIDAGEVISYTASATEEKINKGRINANYNAEVQYETEFSTILNVNLLTSDLLEEIKI